MAPEIAQCGEFPLPEGSWNGRTEDLDFFLLWPQGRLFYLSQREMKAVISEVVSILPTPGTDASASL